MSSAYAPGETTAARDAQCAEHGGQRRSYRRGSDVARFASKGSRLGKRGILQVAVRCPDGPGPCRGQLAGREMEERRRFAIEPGSTSIVRAEVHGPTPGDRVSLRLRSLLGPGEVVVRRRSLLIREP